MFPYSLVYVLRTVLTRYTVVTMSLPSHSRFVHPDIASSHFHFRSGDRVADFGAGSGAFLPALSKVVGKDGKVYACEIQKELVEKIASFAREKKLGNVEPLWSDIEHQGGTKLANETLDGGILANVLFQLEDKGAAFTEMARVMRKGGKLFVIDWTESFGGMGPRSDHVVREDEARSIAESCGFRYERSFPAGEHHYGLALRRA